MDRCPPFDPTKKTKMFKVADYRSIGDNNNIRRNGLHAVEGQETADMIELTHAQAEFHLAKGNIELALPDFDDDTVEYSAIPNSDEGSSEHQTEPRGNEDMGGASTDAPSAKKKRNL